MVASGIGGVILYGGPPPSSLASELGRLRAAEPHGWPLLIASDEEGGGIQRLASLTGALPWARELSSAGPSAIQSKVAHVAAGLHQLDVNVDLAPDADLDAGPGPNAKHPVGKRSFSADPSVDSADVVAFLHGLQRAGVAAVAKHFPGLGTATGNTDQAPAHTAAWSKLKQRDLKPFAAAVGAGVDAVMVANAVVPGLTKGPASLSAAAIKALRRRLGFDGVVITDSLSAGAISATGLSVPQAAVRALAAGADDVLFGTGASHHGAAMATRIRTAIVSAVRDGKLSKSLLRGAAGRVATMLGATTC
jgi:beta-N-acetylhexosaminidase